MEESDRLSAMRHILFPTLLVAAIYLGMLLVDISCPIKLLTGISCPGCGMTRAWLHLLHGDLSGAFSYHPLFWIPALLPLSAWISPQRRELLFWLLLGLVLSVWLIRFFLPADPAVTFAPQNGLLAQWIGQIC
jgi:hypothetical protein